jgi:hypothetical protein
MKEKSGIMMTQRKNERKKEREREREREREQDPHERKLRGHSNCQPKIQFIVWMCRRTLMSFFNHRTDGYINVQSNPVQRRLIYFKDFFRFK